MTTVIPALNVEDGQFDDALEDVGYAHIDGTELIDLTSDEDRDEIRGELYKNAHSRLLAAGRHQYLWRHEWSSSSDVLG
ncbi:uncharacterized protein ARMOST_07092 [Armillaria ostoyae]|uniref:Uncharacterized protein n=1 Tax=Armillaria ostoyae TaxID=47428 RepID=A0A284R4V1_ARMOS|nr:uncharacterized protein ARMOST_07092 [Armillaria ostoyae]